ncbi:MAG: Ig-like domain repeat protein, partial [Ferruginibacter sp.]
MKTTLPGIFLRLYKRGTVAFLTAGLVMLSFVTTASTLPVAVITPATGGLNISADKALNSTTPAFTALTDIVITEGADDDISAGTGITLILTAPTGWKFNPGIGSVSTGASIDVSNASVNITATIITITFDVAGTTGPDIITISGIEVQSDNGALIPSAGQLYQDTGNPGTAVIASITPTSNSDGTGGTNFGSLSQDPGKASKLTFTTQPGLATVGAVFGQQPVVVTQDQFGTFSTFSLPASQNVVLSLSAGTGVLSGTTTLDIGTAAGNGTISFTDLQINLSGVKKLMATSAPLSSVETNDFTVAAASSSTSLTSNVNPSCFGSNITLTATITPSLATGTVEFFDGATSLGTSAVSGGIATLVISTLTAAVHSLTAVYSGDVSYATSTSPAFMQTVNAKSTAPTSATATPATICVGQSSSLTLNGGGGGTNTVVTWYTASCGGTLVGTGNGLSVSPAATTTYFGRYEDPAPCSFNTTCVSVTVTVNKKSANPTSATASPNTICNGGTITLTLFGGGGAAPSPQTVRWYSISCGVGLVGVGNPSTISAPASTTTYYGRYENAAPCNYFTTCASVTVTVNPRPTANITSANTTMCRGATYNITGTITATGTWTLTLSDGTTGTGTGSGTFSIPVTPAATTTFTVSTLTDTKCASVPSDLTGSTTVTLKTPVASAGPALTMCSPGSTTIGGTPSGSGSTGPYTYAWSPALGLSSTTASNPTVTAPPATLPATYTLVVTDAGGCTSVPSSVTITVSGAVTKNWIGSGSSGSGPNGDFNNGANWNPAGVPGPCNDVVINLSFTGTTIKLSGNATIKSLTMSGAFSIDILDVAANTLTILNNTSMTGTATSMQMGVNDASSAGVIDFGGDVSIGTAGISIASFIGNSNSKLIFRKNLTMGSNGAVSSGSTPGSAEFLGTGAQSITWNSTQTSRFNNVIIGDASNNPVVTLGGSQKVGNLLGNLTINGSSTLDLTTNQWNRNTAGGTFQMNGTSLLKLAGGSSTGGVVAPGSNFPGGFAPFSFAPTSTVEYNGVVAQTIHDIPVYGNLTLTNNSIKTAGGPLTIVKNLLINPGATFKANGATGWVHTVGGNWTNNGTFSYVGGTINTVSFNGNTNAIVAGTSTTGFYRVRVDKGNNISTILDVGTGAALVISVADSVNYQSGLMRIQPLLTFNESGTGPKISSPAGIHINGGTFNLLGSS